MYKLNTFVLFWQPVESYHQQQVLVYICYVLFFFGSFNLRISIKTTQFTACPFFSWLVWMYTYLLYVLHTTFQVQPLPVSREVRPLFVAIKRHRKQYIYMPITETKIKTG